MLRWPTTEIWREKVYETNSLRTRYYNNLKLMSLEEEKYFQEMFLNKTVWDVRKPKFLFSWVILQHKCSRFKCPPTKRATTSRSCILISIENQIVCYLSLKVFGSFTKISGYYWPFKKSFTYIFVQLLSCFLIP